MSWLNGLEAIVDERAALAPLTYYRVGGPARWLARPRSTEELCEILRRARQESQPVRVLGQGANLLVSDDGVDGVVVRLDHPALSAIRFENATLTAGGGADMMRVVVQAAQHGLGGLACMAGIPGTIGGCLRGNAGGRFGEVSDCVQRVTAVDRAGCVRTYEGGDLAFSYRRSNLREVLIVGAEFILEPGDPTQRRRRLREIWEYKKKTQPLAARSTGCVFKNPPNDSAGALIERAGLKGASCGGARVSTQHANFIVAENGATASDVRRLMDRVRERVAREFAVDLEIEIEIW